jgi:hypothetical protein
MGPYLRIFHKICAGPRYHRQGLSFAPTPTGVLLITITIDNANLHSIIIDWSTINQVTGSKIISNSTKAVI